MRILAIDPGSEQSAWLVYDAGRQMPHRWPTGNLDGGITINHDLFKAMGYRNPHTGTTWCWDLNLLAIEYMIPRGMPTSRAEMDTQFWAGRFVQSWDGPWRPIYSKDRKMHLCGVTRAKDANIRQALIDRFPATGGGKCPQVGTKKQPGPLYGIKADLWSALAIAITAAETEAQDG